MKIGARGKFVSLLLLCSEHKMCVVVHKLSQYSLINLKDDAECGLAFHYSTSVCNCIFPLIYNRALRVLPVLVYVVYATSIHERISSVCVEY